MLYVGLFCSLIILASCGGPPEEPPEIDVSLMEHAPLPALYTTKNNGDGLPLGATALIGDQRWNCGDSLFTVNYLADGTLLTGGNDRCVQAWDTNGKRLWEVKFDMQITAIEPALNNSALVIAGSGKSVYVLDVATREIIQQFDDSDIIGQPVAVNAAGNLIATDGEVCTTVTYDLLTGKQLAYIPKPIGHTNHRLFLETKDGQERLVLATNPIRIVDPRTGTVLVEGTTDDDSAEEVILDPTKSRLFVIGDGFINELDPDTLALRNHIKTLEHFDHIDVHKSKNFAVLSANFGGLWRWDFQKPPVLIKKFENDYCQSLRISPDGERVAVALSDENRPRFFSTATWKEIDEVNAPYGWVSRMTISHNGKMLAVYGKEISIYALPERQLIGRYGTGELSGLYHACAFSPDNNVLIGASHGNNLILWDLQKNTHRQCDIGINATNLSVLNNAIIASGPEGLIVVDPNTLKTRWGMAPLSSNEKSANATYTPLGVVIYNGNELRLLDPITGAIQHTCEVVEGVPTKSFFANKTADGKLLFECEDYLKLLDVKTGLITARLACRESHHYSMTSSGDYLAISNSFGLLIVNPNTLLPLLRIPTPFTYRQCVFAPDGSRIYTLDKGGNVMEWDVNALLGK